MQARAYRAGRDAPVAATVQQAAHASQAQAQGHHRRDNVRQLPGAHTVLAEDHKVAQHIARQPAEDRAIENEAAVPDAEELPEKLPEVKSADACCLKHDRAQPGADDAADQDPEGQILDDLLAHALFRGPPARKPGAEHKRQEQHGPEAVNRDAVRDEIGNLDRDSEEYLLHRAFRLEIESRIPFRCIHSR